MAWRTLSIGIALALALAASTAHAQEKSCAADAAQAHKSRTEGKLKGALDALKRCASPECAERSECGKEWVEVEALTPSVVVMVRDSKGRDFANAPVIVDGELAAPVDGHSLLVDPGMHTFRIGAFDGIPGEQRVMIHEREKNRVLMFFAEPIAFTMQPAATPVATPASQRTAGPWIIGGMGTLAVVIGFPLTIAGYVMHQDQLSQLQLGGRLTGDASAVNHTGIGLLIGGGVGVTAGLIWYLLESPARTKTAASIPGVFTF